MRLLSNQDILDEARLFDAVASEDDLGLTERMPMDQPPDWYRGMADGTEVVRRAFILSKDKPGTMAELIAPYEPDDKETPGYKAGWVSSMMTTDSVTNYAFTNKWSGETVVRILAVCRGHACSMWAKKHAETQLGGDS